ncbi:MAG: aldo/keto reductase [Actinomycetota bacterium]|nr:aldo/keto reductase [Actinomycetota bacterium]
MADALRIVLGGGNFGGIGSAPELVGHGESEEEAFVLMTAAWEAGIRWFDTADAYGGGRSERAIGRWIRATGNHPRLTTKTFNPMEAGADRGLRRDRILRQLESSLERLGVDSVDVYLAHAFDPDTDPAETMSAFEELVGRGVVRTYGVSNFDGAQLRLALAAGRPQIVQNEFSLLAAGDERDVMPLCAEHGIHYQAFSPLAGGWLTGKYRRGEPWPPGSRMTLRPEPYEALVRERTFEALEALRAEASARDSDLATLAVAWVLSAPGVASVVVGARRPGQLRPALAALDLRLSEEERGKLASLFDG